MGSSNTFDEGRWVRWLPVALAFGTQPEANKNDISLRTCRVAVNGYHTPGRPITTVRPAHNTRGRSVVLPLFGAKQVAYARDQHRGQQ
jgi:hypothetical protein